ncbi:MAG: hypothetical protein Q4F71_03755 [Paracoccus sp. (in: a-proteobacteria)]|nr:hypothetical protein [Paracoccus sp. (in: a-proteobacteria)]
MPFPSGFLELVDTRPFISLWFWLWFITLWAWSGRYVLGVPSETIQRADRALRAAKAGKTGPEPAELPEAALLLDFLSLHVPHWRAGEREGPIMLGLGAFAGASLFVLGFRFGISTAQALFFLTVPFMILSVMRARLAARLEVILDQAARGMAVNDAARAALRQIGVHRTLLTILSLLSVVVTSIWGTLWVLTHPSGL